MLVIKVCDTYQSHGTHKVSNRLDTSRYRSIGFEPFDGRMNPLTHDRDGEAREHGPFAEVGLLGGERLDQARFESNTKTLHNLLHSKRERFRRACDGCV